MCYIVRYLNNMEKIEQSTSDIEIEVLQNIYKNADAVRQRDLARIVGLSLGMTNAIVKRLTQKGWLKIRKVNNRNIHYVVSPAGVEAIAVRSYRYFKRTVRNVVLYKQVIETVVRRARREGFGGVVLVGESDLDFIVEHFCLKHDLQFRRRQAADRDEGQLVLYAEDFRAPAPAPAGERADGRNIVYLRDILINR
jgi:DNA-binding MarR family transcriptional regulator